MTRRQAQQERFFRHLQRASARALDRAMTMAFRNMVSDLLASFMEICEYRSSSVTYPVCMLLGVILVGLLSGENDIKNIETYIRNHPEKVKEYLKEAGCGTLSGMPSDSSMLRALHNVDYLDLLAVVCEWSERYSRTTSALRHIAIDGKALRACLRKCFGGTHPPYILNAFNADGCSINCQIQIGDKTNEIGDLFKLLDKMKLNGAFVTGDAAFSTADAMRAVVKAGGHMAVPIKGNQPRLETIISTYTKDMSVNKPESICHYSDPENGMPSHGHIFWRDYDFITDGVDDLLKGTSFEGVGHAIGVAYRIRQNMIYDDKHNVIGDANHQTVYYIIDTADITAEQFAHFVRNHWAGCEIIHYVLDTEFDEDLSRVRTGNGMQNLSLLRKACITILKSIHKNVKNMSFHTIRMTIRDLGGVAIDDLKPANAVLPVVNAQTG